MKYKNIMNDEDAPKPRILMSINLGERVYSPNQVSNASIIKDTQDEITTSPRPIPEENDQTIMTTEEQITNL